MAIGVDRQGDTAASQDLAEQAQVADGVFFRAEEHEDLVGRVIDGGQQVHGRLVGAEPVKGAAIQLQQHTGLAAAGSASAVLWRAAFPWRE